MLKRVLVALLLVAVPLVAGAATPSASMSAGSVHVDQYGNGEPALVLIPGLTDSGKVWDATVARYSASHRIYVLTLPGFGGLPPVAAPMLDTVDADIAAFLPKANRPVVIGHSMGGFLAIRLAEEHSDLIRGVMAVDGLPVLPGTDALTPAQRATAGQQAAAPFQNLTADQFVAGAKQYVVPYLTKPANVDAVAALTVGADPKASAEYTQELYSADVRPALSRITVPLLELGPFDATLDPRNPSKSFATALEKQAYYQNLINGAPNAKVVMVDDARHFLMYDQPVAFYAALDAFLKTMR